MITQYLLRRLLAHLNPTRRWLRAIGVGSVLTLVPSWAVSIAAQDGQSDFRRPIAHVDGTADDIGRLRRAAERGDAQAQDALGVRYSIGNGVPLDRDAAVRWFQKAAIAGLASAEFHLAEAFANGSGAPQDVAQAFAWYRKAAEQGLADAECAVGDAYRDGVGVWGDDTLAFEWHMKAARLGHARAALAVAEAYLSGKGIGQSNERAFPWLRQAAEQGLARGQYLFGMKHPREPLEEDAAFAATWLRKAAEQDYPDAQYALGTLYEKSLNDDTMVLLDQTKTIPRDLVESDRWFTICWKRSSGEIATRCGDALGAVERQMSRDEVFEAQSRATEWIRAFDARPR